VKIDGLHPVCEARIEVQLELPDDDEITPPCDECAALAMAVLTAEQAEWLRR
jgi:hypothetical protein